MNETGATDLEDNEIMVDEKVAGEDGEVFTRTYFKGNMLGKGGFAKCFEFTDMDANVLYACKVISKTSLAKGKAKQKVVFVISGLVDVGDRNSPVFDACEHCEV